MYMITISNKFKWGLRVKRPASLPVGQAVHCAAVATGTAEYFPLVQVGTHLVLEASLQYAPGQLTHAAAAISLHILMHIYILCKKV